MVMHVVVGIHLFYLSPFLMRTSFGFLLCHGNASHEIEESLAIRMWRNGADLMAVVTHTLPEMLDSFDETIL